MTEMEDVMMCKQMEQQEEPLFTRWSVLRAIVGFFVFGGGMAYCIHTEMVNFTYASTGFHIFVTLVMALVGALIGLILVALWQDETQKAQ